MSIQDDQAVDIQEAAKFLRVRQSFVEELLNTGKLLSITIGTHRLIPRDSLVEYKERDDREYFKFLDEMVEFGQETGTLYATMDD